VTPLSSANFAIALQAGDAILLAFVVGHALAIAGERDHVGDLRIGGAQMRPRISASSRSWLSLRFQPSGILASPCRDGRDEPVLADGRPIGGLYQIDAAHSHLRRLAAQIVERDLGSSTNGTGIVSAFQRKPAVALPACADARAAGMVCNADRLVIFGFDLFIDFTPSGEIV
jgi:hypothetical protein